MLLFQQYTRVVGLGNEYKGELLTFSQVIIVACVDSNYCATLILGIIYRNFEEGKQFQVEFFGDHSGVVNTLTRADLQMKYKYFEYVNNEITHSILWRPNA